ncbi:MAG: dihydrofolate reductase family protein [Spirochaetales bacterium]|nr:dihydrofolate reductase family protein [Spirochaetales bacterium]
MPITTSVFIATSMDGFIARPDGGLDWLTDGTEEEGDADQSGFTEFFASVDGLVMGRNTFETVLSFGAWPYEDRRMVVMSRRPEAVAIPPELRDRVEASSADPASILATLEREDARRVYIDGGLTIQSFLAAGLIDDLIVTRIPVLIGDGIPLFGPLPGDQPLEHVATRTFSLRSTRGIVQSHYRVPRRPA